MNAMELMEGTAKMGRSMSEHAEAYLEAMRSAQRPAVKVGSFYLTFDCSVVVVLKKVTACKCPICSGKGIKIGGLTLPIAGLLKLNPDGSLSAEEPDTGEHVEEASAPQKYLACVIRGGHGIDGYKGDAPGSTYEVGADGLLLMDFTVDLKNRTSTISPLLLSMAGLSFTRELSAKFE